jgi:hypothetical protein
LQPVRPAGRSWQEAEPTGVEEASEEEEGGLFSGGIEAGLSTMYWFRGVNVFQADHQMNLAPMASLGASLTIWEFTLAYWSAYQIGGGGVRQLIREGTGAEQDLVLTWDHELPRDLTLTIGLGAYFYPFADEEDSGAKVPYYLEPLAALTWSGPVEIRIGISWYGYIPESIVSERYLYINPSLAKSFELSEQVGFDLSLGLGYKLRTSDASYMDNAFDVLLSLAFPVTLEYGIYLTPTVAAGWTNLDDIGFGDELTFIASVALGWER